MAPRSQPDDPFTDEDWGGPGDAQESSSQVPEAQVDPNRLPWLKPGDVLPKREGTLELISYQGKSKYSDVTLVVKVGAKQFHLGMQFYDKGFAALRRKFGPDRENWHGTLRYKVLPWKGNPNGFVAVRP